MITDLTPMTSQRHLSVRSLVVEAAAAPAGAPPQLRGRRVVALATAVVAVTTAGALVIMERRTPASTGPWSAVPVQAAGPLTMSRDDEGAWGSQCNDVTGGAPELSGQADDPARAEERDVLVDTRGGYTFCVDVAYGDGTEADPMVAFAGVRGPAAPEWTADEEGVRWGGAGGWNSVEGVGTLPSLGAASLVMFGDPNHVWPNGDVDHAKAAYGPAGADVRGVELVLTDGTRVTATVANGLWGAWWPGWESTAGVAELLVTTTTGTRSVDPESVEYRSPGEAY